MERKYANILLILLLVFSFVELKADVYLVFYATYNGETGHSGIAIDDYRVVIKDKIDPETGEKLYYKDSLETGFLKYFDFWPQKNLPDKENYGQDVEGVYYQLPSSKYKQLISVKTLMDEGIRHRLSSPADGLIRIKTTKAQDFLLSKYLKTLAYSGVAFNAREFNCSDFAELAIEKVTGIKIEARELIINKYSTTPNALFKEVSRLPGVEVELDPGKKADGSFFMERIFKKYFLFQRSHI